MKRKLNMAFAGFSPTVPIEERLVYRLVARHYDICPSGKPDYVILQGAAYLQHYRSDGSIKILLNGENFVADFNAFDYAVGFDHLTFGDRYLRSPLFAHYRSFGNLVGRTQRMSDEQLLNRKFCSFVVSNADFGDPMRKRFFERLSKYKPVASGGRWMNNVGGPVRNKVDFCSGYKFNIAFENSASPGYTTEKIMEAYAAESVPIYYGNPTVETDFRPASMVRVTGEDDIERAVEEVIRLDKDDAAYLAKCRERCFAVPDPHIYEQELESFLCHIFDQPLEKARRRNRYGCQAMMQAHLKKVLTVDQWLCDLRRKLRI